MGMLSRFHYACESDMSTFPQSIRTINAMTLFVPPEAICYYHNHIQYAHLTADLDSHLRVTLFATPIFVGFGTQDADRSTTYFAKTRRYIELAKTFCRPIMADHPVVYHHTPSIGTFIPAQWCVLEYASRDKTRAYVGAFRIGSDKGSTEYVLRPCGLDISRDYWVTLDNSGQKVRMSGWDLVNKGLTIRLDATLTSELVLFSSVSGQDKSSQKG